MEEVSVPRGALGVELEVFYAAVVQDNDFDVLAADIDDHVRVFVKLERGFGVCHGFHQGDIGLQNIFQNVLGVASGRDTQHFELGMLRFNLAAQALEHFNRVLNGIPVRQLIGLAKDVAFFIEQDRFG